MRIAGIDLGSRSVKIVMMEEEKLLYHRTIDTSVFYRELCKKTEGKIEINFDELELPGFDKLVGTGYGRNNVNIKDAEIIVELKAHALGAAWQTNLSDFTLLDIGGQDSKVISVKNKKMMDMLLNDKCAASCGRYLENMAVVLGMDLREMTTYWNNPVDLSSTCAVFAESELIGRIAEGYPFSELAAGINYSLYKRMKHMLEKFSERTLVVTGGVAQNAALIRFIREELDFVDIIVPEYPQLNGAIGCCIFGMK